MSEIQTPTVVEESRVYDIPAYRLPLVEDKISKANRRLERAGVAERFSISTEEYLAKKKVGGTELPDGTIFGGTEIEVPRLKVSLDRFDLAVGDFTFVASLVPEEAGITVHVAPGQSLDGWRPTEFNVCEHCHTHRNRNRVYVVRNNATGELTQVGHTCVELYTGLSIKGLWSLEFDLDEFGGAEEDDDWGGGGFGRTEYSAPVDKVLAYAYVLSDQGRSYASTRVREWGTPTVDLVRHAMFDRIRPPQGRPGSRGYAEARAAYEKLVDDIKTAEKLYADGDPIIAAIKASAETLKSGSDYADNMAVILAGENVSRRNVGILASLVAVYARENQLRIEREKAPAPATGFLGEVKQRVRNIEVILKTVRFIDGTYGVSTLLAGSTPDGHAVKWFASGRHDYEAGDTLKLEAATVKACVPAGADQYTHADTTVLTRGVIDTFDENAEALAEIIAERGESETIRYNTGKYDFVAFTSKDEAAPDGVPSYMVRRGDPDAPEAYGRGYSTEEFPYGYYPLPIYEDRTEFFIDRFFTSAKDKKRFAAWMKAREGAA